jgi:hypothetical protein
MLSLTSFGNGHDQPDKDHDTEGDEDTGKDELSSVYFAFVPFATVTVGSLSVASVLVFEDPGWFQEPEKESCQCKDDQEGNEDFSSSSPFSGSGT